MTTKFFIMLLMLPNLLLCQIIKLKGNVKSTKENVYFLNDSIQNYKFFSTDSDYGHSGFVSTNAAFDRFYHFWYKEAFVSYINNKRFYNKKGQLIKEDWFYKNEEKITSVEYDYNDFDSLSKKTEISGYQYGNHILSFSYNYKKQIQRELSYWTNNSENFSLNIYNYNDDFQLKSEEKISNNGRQSETFYNYNKQGLVDNIVLHKPTVWAKFDSVSYYEKKDSIGTYIITLKKYYNDKKQLIQENLFSPPDYDSESQLSEKKIHIYDDRGNCIETRLTYGTDSNVIYISYHKFDKKDRIIEEGNKTLNHQNDFDYQKKYLFNNKNELTKIIINEFKKIKTITINYKYDSFNNWIEQTKSVDGKKLFVWKREIEYFEN